MVRHVSGLSAVYILGGDILLVISPGRYLTVNPYMTKFVRQPLISYVRPLFRLSAHVHTSCYRFFRDDAIHRPARGLHELERTYHLYRQTVRNSFRASEEDRRGTEERPADALRATTGHPCAHEALLAWNRAPAAPARNLRTHGHRGITDVLRYSTARLAV
jgi:hypothetical protein